MRGGFAAYTDLRFAELDARKLSFDGFLGERLPSSALQGAHLEMSAVVRQEHAATGCDMVVRFACGLAIDAVLPVKADTRGPWPSRC